MMAKAVVAGFSAPMDDLRTRDKERQNRAFQTLSSMTAEPVDWAYEVWDELLRLISEGDNRQRSIVGQLLCNLAKSDPKRRILKDTAVLIELTKDERFVTARHCLLSLWKIAIVGERQLKVIVDGLVQRFRECIAEKNCKLIRYDIQCVLKRIYEHFGDEELRSIAERLINEEEDPKYRKKYSTVWRSSVSQRTCA
jgi:hypothetical protein